MRYLLSVVPRLRPYSTSIFRRSLQMPRIAVTVLVKAVACTPSILTFAGLGGACSASFNHQQISITARS